MFAEDELKDFDFEELDNEIGLGELLKQKDNFFVSLFKKIIFGILVILIGIMVFYASFTIGKVLFLSDSTVPMNPYEQEITDTAIAETTVTSGDSVNQEIVAMSQTNAAPVVAKEEPTKTEPVKPIIANPVVKQESVKQAPIKPIVAAPVVKQEPVKQAPIKPIVTAPVIKKEPVKQAPVKTIIATPVIKKEPIKTATVQPIVPVVTKKDVIKEPITPVVVSVKNIEPTIVKAVAPIVQPTLPVVKEVTTSRKYTLFAGTFGLMENAKKVQSTLASHGFSPEIKTIVKNNSTFYRVIVGTYNDIGKATSSKKVLDSAGIESFLDSSAK